jgi:hypothetical protein
MYPFANLEQVLGGLRSVAPNTWASSDGIVVQAQYFDIVPNLPAPLTDIANLRRGMTLKAFASGGGLVEADVATLGDQPAYRQVGKLKIPDRPTGLAFLGTFIVPKATCSATLVTQAIEQGTTGVRESIVMLKVGPDNFFRPHPFAPEASAGLPFNVADDPAYDDMFPEHPLTRVRKFMAGIAPQLTFAPEFASLPPFAG